MKLTTGGSIGVAGFDSITMLLLRGVKLDMSPNGVADFTTLFERR
jgi:hypothetical protein